MDNLVHYLTLLPPDVLAAILTGTGVSAALMPLKKWLGKNPKVNLFVTVVLSFLTAFIPWLIQNGNANPQLLGPWTVQVVFWATLAYRFVVQPSAKFMKDFKDFKQDQKANADKTTVSVNGVELPPAPLAADPITVEQNKISSEFSF